MFHQQDQETLFLKKCDIKFYFFELENFIIIFYIILISKSIHSHSFFSFVKSSS